jgi:predicted 2-oxoglutarate/Fe(II)-dependent dioxygenase YbiX
MLYVGDPVPFFTARSNSRPDFKFDTVAGRHIALTFVSGGTGAAERVLLAALTGDRSLFDDMENTMFVVSADPADAADGRLPLRVPGVRSFLDEDGAIAKIFGVTYAAGAPVTYLLTPRLTVVARITLNDVRRHAEAVTGLLRRMPPMSDLERIMGPAPITIVPDVFEAELCRDLIARHQAAGGRPSGFMQEIDGRTVEMHDRTHKVRRDWVIDDEKMVQAARARFHRRVAPALVRAYQFNATRMERYLVACYDADERGHFSAHRDNTTKGTAHRRFAATVNLNAGEYDGGELRFPEFGRRTYLCPTGAALIFSCSLMHEATPVTRGLRYAFLPFLYDDAAARVRDENLKFFGAAAPDAS